MKRLIFLIAIVAQAQVTYNPFTDRFDFKAQAGAVNASNTVAGASTTQNVDITSLNLSTLDTAIMACKSPTAPVAFTYSTAGSAPITTVVFTYSSTSDVTCTVNSNGGPGPTGPAGTGDVVGPASSTDSVVALFDGTTGKLLKNSTIASSTIVGGAAALTTAGAPLYVGSAGVASQAATSKFFSGTGNWAFGGTTDNSYKLDIAASGTNGTFRVYDQTATTGSTKMIVRAGAGQSGNLQEWQNAAGTNVAYVTSGGNLIAGRILTSSGVIGSSSGGYFGYPSNGVLTVTNAAGSDFNRLQLGGTTSSFPAIKRSGTAIQVRLADDSGFAPLQAMTVQWGSGTEGTCDSSLRGQVVMVQGGTGVADTLRTCAKDAADVYAWTPLF